MSDNSSVQNFSLDYCGKELKVQIGRLAHQAQGSCTVQYGETVVLATAVIGQKPKEGIDYFPLMVDYEEKLYAAGKIKGSRWIKREGKATDEAVLTGRVIDRSIRPLFKEAERRDVQVMITVLAVDTVNDPDIIALIAASIALSISPIPWSGPVGAIRIGQINGEWVLNGTYEAREKSAFDIYLAATEEAVVMIETSAKQVQEDVINEALAFGHKHLKQLAVFIKDIQKQVGRPKFQESATELETKLADAKLIETKISGLLAEKIPQIFGGDKEATQTKIAELTAEVDALLKADSEVNKDQRAKAIAMLDEHISAAARKIVLETGIRPDGRSLKQLRQISSEVAILPRVHGSGLFNRGETQVLSVVTLGAPGDEQYLDGMEEEGKKRYMHHYNFPAFATGEVKPSRGPGRREIGHGALAEKALVPVIPDKETFPYTIRVVSEVLGSNGSSSQASICGSSLALMDAGVPITAPVAGIAIGLVSNLDNPNDYRVLTDIQGIEDHAFDMDFKVAGTTEGITAIQLDIKLNGISLDVCRDALIQAKEARLEILEGIKKTIPAPRSELSPNAPRITVLHINPDKIRDVIGPGGKIINKIIDECNVQIDIEQDGTVFITAVSADGSQKAIDWVNNLTREVQVGETYEGKVTQIIKDQSGNEIGAITELFPGKDGMIHISNLAWDRVAKVTDVVNIGDIVKVKVIEVDTERGRVSLSRKEMIEKPADFQERPPRTGGFGGRNTGPSHPRSGGRPAPRFGR